MWQGQTWATRKETLLLLVCWITITSLTCRSHGEGAHQKQLYMGICQFAGCLGKNRRKGVFEEGGGGGGGVDTSMHTMT